MEQIAGMPLFNVRDRVLIKFGPYARRTGVVIRVEGVKFGNYAASYSYQVMIEGQRHPEYFEEVQLARSPMGR